MNQDRPDEPGSFPLEHLAAYLDDEGTPELRQQAEAWFADHPEATANVESLRRVAHLWRQTVAPEPTPRQWAAVLAGVEAAILPRAVALPKKWSWRVPAFVGVVGAAAALLVALTLPHTPNPDDGDAPETGPLEVVATEDVEIISVSSEDAGGVVVGVVPVQGPLVLVSAEDVALDNIAPDEDGMVPFVKVSTDATPPMIVAPLPTVPLRFP